MRKPFSHNLITKVLVFIVIFCLVFSFYSAPAHAEVLTISAVAMGSALLGVLVAAGIAIDLQDGSLNGNAISTIVNRVSFLDDLKLQLLEASGHLFLQVVNDFGEVETSWYHDFVNSYLDVYDISSSSSTLFHENPPLINDKYGVQFAYLWTSGGGGLTFNCYLLSGSGLRRDISCGKNGSLSFSYRIEGGHLYADTVSVGSKGTFPETIDLGKLSSSFDTSSVPVAISVSSSVPVDWVNNIPDSGDLAIQLPDDFPSLTDPNVTEQEYVDACNAWIESRYPGSVDTSIEVPQVVDLSTVVPVDPPPIDPPIETDPPAPIDDVLSQFGQKIDIPTDQIIDNNGIAEGINSQIDSLLGLGKILDGIGKDIGGFIDDVKDKIVAIPDAITDGITSVIEGIQSLPSSIEGAADAVIEGIQSIFDSDDTDIDPPLIDTPSVTFDPFHFKSIWHYVTEWLACIGDFISLVGDIWGNLPYCMVVPVYACITIIIVFGVLKRFIGL